MYQLRNFKTNEIVLEDEADEYILDKLGLTMKPLGECETYTIEQLEFLDMCKEWYFSDNWTKEKIKNEDDDSEDFDAVMEDKKYQDSLERKWGLY